MSIAQRQDLLLFHDHSVISDRLYQSGSHHMITISASPSTSPAWLINSLVENEILGKPYSLNTDKNPSRNRDRPLTIGSFIHEPHAFHTGLQRLQISPRKYKVVDLLTDFVVKALGKPRNKIYGDIVERFPSMKGSIIILEQPELLLSLLDGSTGDEIHSRLIAPLMKRCSILVIVTTIYNDMGEVVTKECLEYSRFTLTCFYKSIVIMNLRPLETGRANDVTGVLRIIKGGITSPIAVVENEYFYLNQREMTRLFYG